MIKEPEKKPSTPFKNPDTGFGVKKMFSFLFPILASVRNVEESFNIIAYKFIFKGTNILKCIFMHPKNKMASQLKQTIVYKWSDSEENCNSFLPERI